MEPEELDNTEIRNTKERTPIYGSVGSLGIHVLVVIGFIIFSRYSDSFTAPGGYYVDVMTVKGTASEIPEKNVTSRTEAGQKPADKTRSAKLNPLKEEKASLNSKETSEAKPADEKNARADKDNLSGFQSIEDTGFDSTSLGQIYREPTLNVQMHYPSGWVFVDQQRKKKLDGITFWAEGSNFNPPPYIHVEVVEKYIFNPELYRHKYDFGSFTGYYNDPVEMEGQVSQIIFIRTEDPEDYSIKLIMVNKEAFRQFQPVFFAIIKSFRFGSSFLF